MAAREGICSMRRTWAKQALTELAVQELAQDLALDDAVGDSLAVGDKLVEPVTNLRYHHIC